MEVNIYEAKTNLSKLVQMLIDESEEEITLCKNGSPVVKMTLIKKTNTSKRIGAAKKEMAGFKITLEEFNNIPIDDFYGD